MSFPTCFAACFVIQRIFEEKWDISIAQLHGWGSLGSRPVPSSPLCALWRVSGPLAEGGPASRPSSSEVRAYLTWVPQKSHDLCVLNGAPRLSSKLPLVSLLSSCFTTAWPLAPSPIPQSLRTVLLPSSWSSGRCSCHALTSSVQATSVFHLDYGSFLRASLLASGFAPPPSRHCNQRGLLYCKVNAIMLFPFKIFQKISVAPGLSPISLNSLCKAFLILFPSGSRAGSFTTGYSSHPSPSSSLPE